MPEFDDLNGPTGVLGHRLSCSQLDVFQQGVLFAAQYMLGCEFRDSFA